MNINSLEINLLKASEINDGDIVIVKIDEKEKNLMNKETIQSLYNQITGMIKKKNISIYFFPKNISISMIKNNIKNMQEQLNTKENSNNEN